MSVANALAFIRQLRGDLALQDALAAAPRGEAMPMLCAMARAAGKRCEPAHIEEAFVIEWAARRAHFARKAAARAAGAPL